MSGIEVEGGGRERRRRGLDLDLEVKWVTFVGRGDYELGHVISDNQSGFLVDVRCSSHRGRAVSTVSKDRL
jgi:hypothetical protein